MVVEEYLEAKYAGGGPDGGRFEPRDGDVHSSHLSDCRRKRHWKHRRATRADPSPYFELGRVFETLYGAALAYEHDPAVGADELKSSPPWEVARGSDVVIQDVNVAIEVTEGATIVGEADWVVLRDGAPEPDRVAEPLDGGRTGETAEGERLDYDGWAEKVVETKTKKDLKWVRGDGPDEKHEYQVYPYMRALDCPGEIAYMQRNDWAEHVFPVELDEATWLDCRARALDLAEAQSAGSPPEPNPLGESECRWCPHKDECGEFGGSPHLS
jgi:CRISPR/Cas system-associated exonuclease Cas4 (RecB family)